MARKALLNLYLDQDQFDFIADMSVKTGKSRASLVRGLVKQYKTDVEKTESLLTKKIG